MTDRERLRLFDALLGEGLAIADGEAGSDNELARRWATRVHAARRQYWDDVEDERSGGLLKASNRAGMP